jgi:NAD(P)-dependent dehydrogenase (short-subunit alcohol dehydrogenase family)
MASNWELDGRTALITGAARGIGLGTAQALAKRGVRVAMLDVDGPAVEAAAAGVPGAVALAADVTDRNGLGAAVDRAVAELGGLDIVMANAGVAPTGFIRSVDEATFERTIAINLVGVWRTVRLTLPHVMERRGYVLNVASLAAIVGTPVFGSYGPSKAAVESFSNQLRMEVAHHGVDVGCGYFGFIDTDMVRGAYVHPAYELLRSKLKGPIGKTYPISKAIDAVVAGIEGRARLVYAPKWVRAAIAAGPVLVRLSERDARKHLPEAEAAFEREVAEKGVAAASSAAGPGGEAATAAQPRGE